MIEVTDNEEVCLLLDIILVDITDGVGVSDGVLVNITDDTEVPSLLEIILRGVMDTVEVNNILLDT